MGKIIGIDLGTTNSAVAIYDTVTGQATILENLKGKRTTPSVVALKKGKLDKKTKEMQPDEWIVGEDAKRQAAVNPHNTFYGVKRLIGRRADDAAVEKMKALASYDIISAKNGDAWVEADGKPMAPAEISSKILRELKEAVEKQLGETITEAVVTVPAYFNDAQRQATIDAGRIAGLDIKRIINEPTAAALAYGMNKKKGGKLAVYDLGGGTFDISILEVDVEDGVIKVLGVNGDTFLGGENFDEAITARLVEELNKEHGTDIDLHAKDDDLNAEEVTKRAQTIQRLREAAEKAKIELSGAELTNINIPFLMQTEDGETINFEMDMTRSQLEDILKGFVAATLEPTKLALKDAGLTVADLDEVILVGGQTRMPLVIETVKGFFGKEPRRDVNPDEIVAMGAAVQGGVLNGDLDNILLLDVIPLSLGIRAKNDLFIKIVERNTTIPCTMTQTFFTSEDNQDEVQIKLYQGEREKASANNLLGEFTLGGLPPGSAGKVEIEVALNIDADGVVTVTAKNAKNGVEQKVTVKANGGLSESDVARMLKDAEANAERDRLHRASLTAGGDADLLLKQAANDEGKEYFTVAPEELKAEFRTAVEELTKARKENDVAKMLDQAKKLSTVRAAIGDAFNNSSTPASNDDAATAAPAAEQDNTAPKAAKPAAQKPPAA